MPRIPTLYVQFDLPLKAWQLNAFRGAVASKVGWQHDLFHNHSPNGKVQYRYPLVQYKRIAGKAALLALGEGVEEMQQLFQQKHWDLDIQGEPQQFQVDTLRMQPYQISTWDHLFQYKIRNWLGLNDKNYQRYQSLTPEEQKLMLQKILTGNILSMAKGLGWYVDQAIHCEIDEMQGPFWQKARNVTMLGHNLSFRCNVSLPFPIGLGKMASLGHGTVSKINQTRPQETEEENASNA